MMEVQLRKKLGDLVLDTGFSLKAGERGVLFGPSGSGKTTILKILAGLVHPEKGRIQVNQDVWFDSEKKIKKAAHARKTGFVFQDYALFPHLTVKENIAFGLEKPKKMNFVMELMEMMELLPFAKAHPKTLSGGQKQRVALARALARRPEVLLLDEPFSALDLKISVRLQEELLRIQKYFNLTLLLVTHQPHEAIRLAERLFYLDQGTIAFQGSPEDFFEPVLEHGYFPDNSRDNHAENLSGKRFLENWRMPDLFFPRGGDHAPMPLD